MRLPAHMTHCLTPLLKSSTIICLMGLWALPMTGRCQDLPILTPVNDVEVHKVSGISGLVAVTLENSSGEHEIRILDLDTQVALAPTNVKDRIADAEISSFHAGMVYSQSPKSGGNLVWTLLDGTIPMTLSSAQLKKSELTFGRLAGEYIFVGELGADSKELFRVSSSTIPTLQQISRFGGRNTTPHTNPISGVIAYSTSRKFPGWDVCLFDPASGKDFCPLGNAVTSFCRPRWSPIGDKLVFSRGQGSAIDLYEYRPSNGLSQRLTSLENKEYDGAWSPDGTHIVFSHNPEGGERYELKVVRLADRSVFRLASSTASIRRATWASHSAYSTPTVEPVDTPSSHLPIDQNVSPSLTPAPSVTPVPSASKVRIITHSRTQTLVRVKFITSTKANNATFKIQIGDRTINKRASGGAATLLVTRPSKLRVAVRLQGAQFFSEWSPWVTIAPKTRSRSTK